MIWILLTFLGCSTPDPDPVACEGLSEADCEAAAGCFPVRGAPVHGDYSCDDHGPEQFTGCTGKEASPEGVNVYRAPREAPQDCWWFGSGSEPDGWVKCEPTPYCDNDSGVPDWFAEEEDR